MGKVAITAFTDFWWSEEKVICNHNWSVLVKIVEVRKLIYHCVSAILFLYKLFESDFIKSPILIEYNMMTITSVAFIWTA